MSAHGGTKAIVAALSANLGIAVTKFGAFLLSGSSSMLAESVHSVADSGNQLLLLWGGREGKKAPDAAHPFGYGRGRYFWAFVVALVLFSLGGLFALYEAWEKYHHPEPIEAWHWVPVAVIAASLVMESFSLRTAIREARPVKGPDRGWVRFIREAKTPELPVVLLEDTAALVGLVLAGAGVGLTLYTKDGRWDAGGSAAIGLLLIIVAIILAKEMRSLLLGESPIPQHVRAIEQALVGPGIVSVIHLRVMHLGPDELLVAAKVEPEPGLTMAGLAQAINAAEARARAAVPLTQTTYLEPDLRQPSPQGT
ncbi:MAG: cation diffusion facilitator family transporter [Bifidobacteriaceae bacterium]|jgi:cation diffusion facilitator family transporter|nr:cation diffusion facilitator family transporter [Bifidobacteriaceae bacterium]